MTVFDLPAVEALIKAALAEDVGSGDLTTQVTVDVERQARAEIRAKGDATVAGMPLIRRICDCAGGGIRVEELVRDGTKVRKGDVLARLSGSAHALLSVERLILNLLQQLSGVATLTARFVEAVRDTRCRIVDTRKTVPGLRALQKYAVRTGGGHNHRQGLSDGILIKNNHITAAGGIGPAVIAARAAAAHVYKIEVECRTMSEVDEALGAGADALLLDNMTPEQLAAAVKHINGRAITEASGGVNLDTVRRIAATGVDIISVGALTHSAPAVDLHMLLSLT
ncbi:MAG: carboxylating nicotinate-nucleotide diphosphorylase [Deltaproteobacteria bacterium]|nr:carboxylating nicotinate-nucleotide diphosphorylase [Deltaproteobacteria bacterium]